MVRGLLTRVMVLVTPPTTVVTTWACWATVTVPDLCTVMMGLVGVLGEDPVADPTWAAAVFSMRVAGLLTCNNISFRAIYSTSLFHIKNVSHTSLVRCIHVKHVLQLESLLRSNTVKAIKQTTRLTIIVINNPVN